MPNLPGSGLLGQNGGQTPASCSWKCKMIDGNKKVTGQHVIYILDCQQGQASREEATKKTGVSESQTLEKKAYNTGEPRRE